MAHDKIRCGIVGYGPVFNWGWMHARWIGGVPDLELVAICDRAPECAAKARTDWPEVDVYEDLARMLARDDLDLVSVVTQHNTHAALVVQCLEAGKHVVVEKPMCISVAEATGMIETAKRAGRTLAVYHNRRHDGNVRAIHELVREGTLGDVFHIEVAAMGFGPDVNFGAQADPWRASKAVSGGGLYDWGAHAIDWVLSMVPSPMAQVTGFFHRPLSPAAANEDQTRAIVRFENGCVAEIMWSRVAYIPRPYLWLVLGTKGAILDTGAGAIEGYCHELNGPSGGSLTLRTAEGERQVPYRESDWLTYYGEIADHLLWGGPVPVTGEDGRRVICVLETAERSAKNGRSEPMAYA